MERKWRRDDAYGAAFGFWRYCVVFMVGADELELENISLSLSLTYVSGYGLIPTVNRGLFL